MNCEYKREDRTGLYIMIFIIFLYQCSHSNKLQQIEDKLDRIKSKCDTQQSF